MEDKPLTKMDVSYIILLFSELVRKGYDIDALMTSEEYNRMSKVIDKNSDISEFEDIMHFEELHRLLVKAGVRNADTSKIMLIN
jgi:hypothetical protein